MTRDKLFSSNVADSDSPYKPLKVVPKDSPLVPWKPGPQEDGLKPARIVPKDSPLTAYGTDGKPLGGGSSVEQVKDKDKKCIPFICRLRQEPKRVLNCEIKNDTNNKSIEYLNKLFYKVSSNDIFTFYLEIDKTLSSVLRQRENIKIKTEDNKIKLYEGHIDNPAIMEQFFTRMSKSPLVLSGGNPDNPLPYNLGQVQRNPPPWYHGFIFNSYVTLNGSPVPGDSSRRSGPVSSGVPAYVKVGTYHTGRSILDFNFDVGIRSKVQFAEKRDFIDVLWNAVLSGDESKYYSLILLLASADYLYYGVNKKSTPLLMDVPQELREGACSGKDTVAFNHIEIGVKNPGDKIVNISDIEIFLNNTLIYSWKPPHPGWNRSISYGHPLVLDEGIKKHKLSRVGIEGLPRPDSILAFAANELGQSWHPKRPGQWIRYCSDNHVLFWAENPVSWCSDFALYVIKNTTSHMHEPEYRNSLHNWGSDFVDRYFSDEAFERKINYITCPWYRFSRFDFQDVKPGFYTKIRRSTHSTFFIEWVDGFDPTRDENVFRAIGGNQSKRVNISDDYTLKEATSEDDSAWGNCPTVSWSEHCNPDTYPDGFIDVRDNT